MSAITSSLKRRLVAHRGDSDHYPENSLQGFQSALDVGACYVETDIQITNDNVAILSHDASLLKITGHDALVSDCDFDDIKNLSAPYEEKFGHRYADYKLSTLQELSELIARYPNTQLFVEIKHECVVSHGNEALDIVLSAIERIKNQVILISFNYQILQHAKQLCHLPLGWVWPEEMPDDKKELEEKYGAMCAELNPAYVFCDKDELPSKNSLVWRGNWTKAIYTIATMDQFQTYSSMGFSLFETNNITGHNTKIEAL